MKKKILVLNDGDLYGYIFSIFILNKIPNVNLVFVKLKEHESLKKINVISHTSLNYFKNSNLNLDEIIRKSRGAYSLSIRLNNFFKEENICYITNEKENLDSNGVEFIKKYFSENIKIQEDIYSLLYNSVLLSENNLFDLDICNDVNLNFENYLIKNYIKDICLKHDNFEYIENDEFNLDLEKYNILIDNTYENKLTVNKINNDVSDFKCNQSIITYKNKEFQIKNYIEYTGYDDKIIENIYLYDNIVSNEYLFKNNSNQSHLKFYENNIMNIGTSFIKDDFCFFYDQILNFYIIEKTIHLIDTMDFRESKLYALQKEFEYVYQQIKTLVNNLFLYSNRINGFWNNFNNIESVHKINLEYDSEILNIQNKIFDIFKNFFFKSDIKHTNYDDHLHKIFKLYDIKFDKEFNWNSILSNQYQYIKQNIYKEKEELNLLR